MNRIFPGVITMPLQIRRGTDTERLAMTVPLAQGELLYVTDDQRLYIGNGSTLGGVAITGYTDEDARDAIGPMFENGVHTGIAFTYSDTSDRIDAVVDLTSYNGAITGDLTGSVFADSSTQLIDGTEGKFNLDGTVNTNIVPDADSTYDLGSASYKFKDLYLSGSSIYLGDALITSDGAAVNLPAGSLIGGVPIGSGGSDVSGNIIGDDSTVIVNTALKTVTATGGFFGTLEGDVVGTDSTVLVDSATSSLKTSFLEISGNVITTTSGSLSLGSNSQVPSTVEIKTDDSIRIDSVTETFSGAFRGAFLTLRNRRNSLSSPATIELGDTLGGLEFSSYTGTSFSGAGGFQYGGVIGMAQNEDIAISPTSKFLGSKFFVACASDSDIDLNTKLLTYDSAGLLSAVTVQTRPQSTVEINAITAAEGMIVFDTTTKEFKGYNGSAWVVLG